MIKTFNLVAIDSEKIYLESNDCASFLRWLGDEYGCNTTGIKNIALNPMPESMKVIHSNKSPNQ